MTNTEEKRRKNNVSCEEIPILECLWWCEGCLEFFRKIKEEQEKRAIEEKMGEVEVMVNECGDLGKWVKR